MNDQKENIKIVQQLYEAFDRKDIPAILEKLSHDVEWGEPENPYNPSGGTHHGHGGFLEWVETGRQVEEILIFEPRKMLLDEDSVAVVGYMKIRASNTGKVFESDFVHLITLKASKVIKFQEFFDTYGAGEAFRA